jgi:uncharacterized BrkB/YihY/UPF0761 family membrane protein
MLDFNFWRRWLLAVGVIITAIGAVIALLSWSPVFSIFNWLVDNTFWPGALPSTGIQSYQLWVYGMLGATMVGWGIFFTYIIIYPLVRKEAWAWDCIALGVAAWFVIDTAVSAYVGAYFNLAINLLLLALVALPLAATRREFTRKR